MKPNSKNGNYVSAGDDVFWVGTLLFGAIWIWIWKKHSQQEITHLKETITAQKRGHGQGITPFLTCWRKKQFVRFLRMHFRLSLKYLKNRFKITKSSVKWVEIVNHFIHIIFDSKWRKLPFFEQWLYFKNGYFFERWLFFGKLYYFCH